MKLGKMKKFLGFFPHMQIWFTDDQEIPKIFESGPLGISAHCASYRVGFPKIPAYFKSRARGSVVAHPGIGIGMVANLWAIYSATG